MNINDFIKIFEQLMRQAINDCHKQEEQTTELTNEILATGDPYIIGELEKIQKKESEQMWLLMMFGVPIYPRIELFSQN